MKILVTGSSGHLGEALVRSLSSRPHHEVTGLDRLPSPWTRYVGSICDAEFVSRCTRGIDVVLHTATLHKPHIETHSRRDFVETNITGTLNVLEAAVQCGVAGVIFTSTTSAFGGALKPDANQRAAWITEEVRPVPRNIYGVTKVAAEDLCELFHRSKGLPCVVLRTSRFFPNEDDNCQLQARFDDVNLKVNEFLYRRLDLADAVEAHLLAADQVGRIGFGRYIVSATTPLTEQHLAQLQIDPAVAVRELFPDYEAEYQRRGWKMLSKIDRVYVNRLAREELGWRPQFDFQTVIDRLRRDESPFSELATSVGCKGYHAGTNGE